VGKGEGRRPLGRPRRRWEDDIYVTFQMQFRSLVASKTSNLVNEGLQKACKVEFLLVL
jgi:hypothetical protein